MFLSGSNVERWNNPAPGRGARRLGAAWRFDVLAVGVIRRAGVVTGGWSPGVRAGRGLLRNTGTQRKLIATGSAVKLPDSTVSMRGQGRRRHRGVIPRRQGARCQPRPVCRVPELQTGSAGRPGARPTRLEAVRRRDRAGPVRTFGRNIRCRRLDDLESCFFRSNRRGSDSGCGSGAGAGYYVALQPCTQMSISMQPMQKSGACNRVVP